MPAATVNRYNQNQDAVRNRLVKLVSGTAIVTVMFGLMQLFTVAGPTRTPSRHTAALAGVNMLHGKQALTTSWGRDPEAKPKARSFTNEAAAEPLAGERRLVALEGGEPDVELVWQRPTQTKIRAVIFLAHGCSHSATDWWPASSPSLIRGSKGCAQCVGLPEEGRIVQEALKKGWVAVAISSKDRQSKCWSGGMKGDATRVVAALRNIIDHGAATGALPWKNYIGVPLLAFGASSGGSFVSSAEFNDAIYEYGGGMVLEGYNAQIGVAPRVADVPAVLTHMETRDSRTAALVRATILEHDPITFQSPILELKVEPLSLTAPPTREEDARRGKLRRSSRERKGYSFFSERIPRGDWTGTAAARARGLSFEQSETLVAALIAADALDSKGGFLQEDPRSSEFDWRALPAFQSIGQQVGDSLVADASGIAEVLNVAFARHEISADQSWQAFNFLASHCARCGAHHEY